MRHNPNPKGQISYYLISFGVNCIKCRLHACQMLSQKIKEKIKFPLIMFTCTLYFPLNLNNLHLLFIRGGEFFSKASKWVCLADT